MHLFVHHHNEPVETQQQPGETQGLVLNWGWRYDLMVWALDTIVFRGKLKEIPYRAADLAQLQNGETVLDVGCGTGTLALVAKERVGTTGRVFGIDPGPQQIARAQAKAARRHLPIDFQLGVIERLAFPDQSFDVVLSTAMMHHLTDDLKRRGFAEIVRVLKPGGRVVIVDFNRPEKHEHNHQHTQFGAGEMGMQDLPPLLQEAGFTQIETGEIPLPRMPIHSGAGFVRARTGS
jgi:ubiquinone/menaquinone biosynthesis C-methylase UbiE